MAILSLDQALANATANPSLKQFREWNKTLGIAAVSGRHYNLFTAGGQPGAATYSGTALALQQVTGGASPSHPSIAWVNATGGRKLYFNDAEAQGDAASSTGRMILVDLVAYYPGINTNTTTNTLTNSLSIPRYTDGVGLHALLDVTTTLGVTQRTITLTYTDQAGNGSQTTAIDLTASMPAGTIAHLGSVSPFPTWFIPFGAGDYGIRSVQSANLNAAMGAGVVALALVKPLIAIPISSTGTPNFRPTVLDPVAWHELGDNAALTWIYTANAAPAAAAFSGIINCLEG